MLLNGIEIQPYTEHECYSDDYYYLTKNWIEVCRRLNVDRKKIILIDNIDFDDKSIENIELLKLYEKLTNDGYVIRRKSEFVSCKNCSKLLLSYEKWEYLKNMKAPVCDTWDNKCLKC